MQLIVDVVSIDDHQVEGHVTSLAMPAPLAFCGWLDFVRVLEVVLGGVGPLEAPGPADANTGSTGSATVRADEPPAA